MYARMSMPQQLANFKSEFFKALAHPVRIRILDCLRDGEKGVNELSEMLKIEPANVSQQLAILRMRNIVIGRKAGSNVYYSVSDPTVFGLLDVARDIFNNHLVGVRDMLLQMQAASHTHQVVVEDISRYVEKPEHGWVGNRVIDIAARFASHNNVAHSQSRELLRNICG